MPKNNRNLMLTTGEVANLLNVHTNTVRRWSDQGILNPYRIGPRSDRRFMQDDIISFLSTSKYSYTVADLKNRNQHG